MFLLLLMLFSQDDSVTLIIRNSRRYKLLSPEQEILFSQRIQDALKIFQQIAEREGRPWPKDGRQVDWREQLNRANRSQQLTPQEQKRLKAGLAARQNMINANMRLVISLAKKDAGCRRTGAMELADLVQEGLVGLCRAVEKFDPAKGYRFTTYAFWWIRQAIWRSIDEKGRTIRFPIHFSQQLAKLNRIEAERRHLGLSVQAADLAELMYPGRDAMAAQQAIDSLRQVRRQMDGLTSLDVRIGDSDSCLGDFQDSGIDSFAVLEHEIVAKLVWAEIAASLPPREAEFLQRRAEGQSLAAIAADFNVSRERVRQITDRAKRQLKNNPVLQEINHA